MIEIRIHGRGGQGIVVASKVLAEAAFLRGRYVQSYPDYGVERRGAPVVAFARIAGEDDALFVRQDITEPHHVLVLDPTLIESAPVLAGLRSGGWVVLNTAAAPDRLPVPDAFRVATVDASGIASDYGLGTRAQPVVNTAILGAFVRVTGLVTLDDLLEAIDRNVPAKREANREAAAVAFATVVLGAAV